MLLMVVICGQLLSSLVMCAHCGWWSFVGGCRVQGGGRFMIVTVGSRCGQHSLCVGTVHGPWMSFVIHRLSHGCCGHL